jgi:hypothetical protein
MRKFTTVMLIIIILSTTIGAISFGNTSHKLLEENTISQKIQVPWFKIAWKVISYAGNEWFDRDPVYKEFDNYQYVSSGDIDFNEGEIGGRASHKVEIPDKHRRIDAFVQANWIHFLSKLVILIDDSNGDDVLSKTVSHD